MNIKKEDLIEFIKDKVDFDDLDEKTLLFSEGNLDSVSQLDLIAFIEDKTGVQVEQLDVTLENFDSIERILIFITKKKV